MGQAKLRGTKEQRKVKAIEEGRIKYDGPKTSKYASMPTMAESLTILMMAARKKKLRIIDEGLKEKCKLNKNKNLNFRYRII